MSDARLAHGWASELRVAADLISRGYEVYFGFGHTSCDFIATKAGRILRIEVKTAYIRNGLVAKRYPVDNAKHDVMALVLPHAIDYLGTDV